MPHIRNIRLVNVYFNNATQFYDDFKMRFEGKNATYDLENGGGKSLLLLMLLQTVLPKSYLRKEKPVSLLFQGGKDRTSHVAVEWILEDGSQYKYLLTGFSCRKRKVTGSSAVKEASEEDENVAASDIEHINWCVFYNDARITDIQSAPLCEEESGKKIYATFDDIRRYIQQTKQKGLPAEVFDGIDKYQSFISSHQLISAEWNIIRGINSGENSIEAYFRQNTTSRKLIENLFIKIIEDIEALNKGEKNRDESFLLADALIEIRERLSEYLKLKGHMAEFEKIKQYYIEYSNRNIEQLKAFKVYENYKIEAVGIRNLIMNNLQRLKEEEANIQSQLVENIKSRSEGAVLLKQLQAGLVQFEISELEFVKNKLANELTNAEKTCAKLNDKYNEVISLEWYSEYKKHRVRLLETEKSLLVLEKDHDKVNEEYRTTAGKLKHLIKHNLDRAEAEKKEAEAALSGNEAKRKDKNSLLIKQSGQEAALQSEIKPLKEKDEELRKVIDTLYSNFIKNGETDVLVNPQSLVEKIKSQKLENETEQNNITQRMAKIVELIQKSDIAIENSKGEINLKEHDWNSKNAWLEQYQMELNGLKQKAEGFERHTLEDYSQELKLQIEREELSKLEYGIEAGRLKQKKQLSDKRGYYVPNEELISFAELLSSKCEYVKLGVDWISELDSDKAEVLKNMPFLPFSIIVDAKSFKKLCDGRIRVDYATDYSVPLVSTDALRDGNAFKLQDIFYFCSFEELLLSNIKYEQYIRNIDEKLNTIKREIEISEKRAEMLNNDLQMLAVFVRQYPDIKVDDVKKQVESLSHDIFSLKTRKKSIESERSVLENEREALSRRQADLQKGIVDINEKLEKLNIIFNSQNERNSIGKEIKEKDIAINSTRDSIAAIKAEIESLESETRKLQEMNDALLINIYELKKEKMELESFTEIENEEILEVLRPQYISLRDKLSGKLADEENLRSIIDERRESIKNLSDRISRDYHRDLDSIWVSENRGALVIIPTQEAIKIVKKEKENAEDRLTGIQSEIMDLKVKISEKEGKKGEILKDISDKEINGLPVYENKERYLEEINVTNQLLESYYQDKTELEKRLEKNKKDSSDMSICNDYYNSFIKREKVPNVNAMASEIKDFKIFEEEYIAAKNSLENLAGRWSERITVIRQETVAFIIREPLEELAKISLPENASQCDARRQAFEEYISNIDQQMNKIAGDIRQLENYQQDFARRCIQRAELILGHLRKIEALSKIEVYGRRTNIIELKLQEFEDKEKQLRMKNYIDSIIREIGEGDSIDRKRVAMKLSTKELIAQIADMDKAAVKLYKIESIPENSRFYKWENAIGSEGQNNSLYFIFAACLISFIRMLSITNTSLKTKKVIIADNPFGATSAVYLWEPMFNIMKQNDIQLIAPGHRIPREITSKFAVSYLLTQDTLQDGRRRVVVKDVRVEEDEEVMKYIEPEQLSLFN